jgi:multidrug resistance protein, MATE family
MSSTYAHYQGPSSLPSDYAILSRLNTDSNEAESDLANTVQTRHVTRRESFPVSHYYRPLNPTIGTYPRVDSHSEASQHLLHAPTETTSLLNHPPVPRIEENIDTTSADNVSTLTVFWEELVVLTKYTMPVFGYTSSFIL